MTITAGGALPPLDKGDGTPITLASIWGELNDQDCHLVLIQNWRVPKERVVFQRLRYVLWVLWLRDRHLANRVSIVAHKLHPDGWW